MAERIVIAPHRHLASNLSSNVSSNVIPFPNWKRSQRARDEELGVPFHQVSVIELAECLFMQHVECSFAEYLQLHGEVAQISLEI